MHITSPISSANFLPTSVIGVAPAPPARWSRFWTSPIAHFSYGMGSRVPLFNEARIPGERGLTGQLRPGVTYAGATLEDAIEAARVIAMATVAVSFSFRNGRLRTIESHPAVAVLRDARAGAFWIAPLQTTVQLRGEWVEAPHSIDGAAFDGRDAMLRTPTILSATRDMVAVVGRDSVIKPQLWIEGQRGSAS